MIVEIKIKPSKEIQEDKEWFPIHDTGGMIALCGDNAYARVLNEEEYILVEPTTADEFNMEEHELLLELESKKDPNDFIIERDPGDEHMGSYLDIDVAVEKHSEEDYDRIVEEYNHTISYRDPGDEHIQGTDLPSEIGE